MQMSKGYFAFPTYSIQGQQIDINSTNIQIPIDAAGSMVEYSDLCFVNEGKLPYFETPAAATLAGNIVTIKKSNELILGGGNQGTIDQQVAGCKSMRFLPAINKLEIEIAGQSYMGNSLYDLLHDNP